MRFPPKLLGKLGAGNTSFLGLPQELRSHIDNYCFFEDGGSEHSDHRTGKLPTARKTPINLSLLYLSKKIFHEANDIPFSANKITIKSELLHDKLWGHAAARFDQAYNERHDICAWLVNQCRSCITERIRLEVVGKFPISKAFRNT